MLIEFQTAKIPVVWLLGVYNHVYAIEAFALATLNLNTLFFMSSLLIIQKVVSDTVVHFHT